MLSELTLNDLALVGGKNASLGQLVQLEKLSSIKVPAGFATTSTAYWYFLTYNKLQPIIHHELKTIKDTQDTTALIAASKKIRSRMERARIPPDLSTEIIQSYRALDNKKNTLVALRSSATAEDLPTASFAGQHESFLCISGTKNVLHHWLRCVSSLYTPRAIAYRMLNHIAHEHVTLSVGVQHMVRAQCAGVAFTLDTESGFDGVVSISATYGLGETLVQGSVNPDEYYVHKERLDAGFKPILTKICGSKKIMLAPTSSGMKHTRVLAQKQKKFCLSNQQILELARQCMIIEKKYSALNNAQTPMDIEWALSNRTLFILQARPETVHARQKSCTDYTSYHVTHNKSAILTGQAIGQQAVQGTVFVSTNVQQAIHMPDGAILVTDMTNPDWVPIMKRATAIVTNSGSRTCHAAIVSRELGIPALVGTQHATRDLKTGQQITIDCSTGSIGALYRGHLNIKRSIVRLDKLQKPPVPIMLNIGIPSQAFSLAALPVSGVGLARTEFIIAHDIHVHPQALIDYKKLPRALKKKILEITAAYQTPTEFFVSVLAQQIAMIAAAFWPKPVLVRISDFKSNEYRNLVGGELYEDSEQNPMLGKRGAFRYYGTAYKHAFELECAALARARDIKGFDNIQLMVPMVRNAQEAQIIQQLLKKIGLLQSKPRLQVVFMCETPAAALQIKQLARFCDGFSIGSNDLAQFTLAVDREDSLLAKYFSEQDPAVLELIKHAIQQAHKAKKTIGICGQAPSDLPAFRTWLIKNHIDYVSLNADAVIPALQNSRSL